MAELLSDWCDCPDTNWQDVIFFPDNCCPCGEPKHHYHCPACMKIVQIG